MTVAIPDDLARCIDFHGHFCPGLTIGYCASKIALETMRWKRAEDEELLCIAMSDGCAVDAIQLMTGCTLGKGNLIFQDYGKMVFMFLKRKEGNYARGIRLSFQLTSRMKKIGKERRNTKEKFAQFLLTLPRETIFVIFMGQ